MPDPVADALAAFNATVPDVEAKRVAFHGANTAFHALHAAAHAANARLPAHRRQRIPVDDTAVRAALDQFHVAKKAHFAAYRAWQTAIWNARNAVREDEAPAAP